MDRQVSPTFCLLRQYQHYVDSLAICLPIQILLKTVLLLADVARYPPNNAYCANFVATILVLAVIERRAEGMGARSDLDRSIPIVAAAAR